MSLGDTTDENESAMGYTVPGSDCAEVGARLGATSLVQISSETYSGTRCLLLPLGERPLQHDVQLAASLRGSLMEGTYADYPQQLLCSRYAQETDRCLSDQPE
jgi:hypothetical protein